MCGITGIVFHQEAGHLICEMSSKLSHRGPDGTGIYVNSSGSVALGHNRLSILDLREIANQPFYSADGRYVLVYNGEVYNYLELKEELKNDFNFKTNTDSEVVLAAWVKWKQDCLHRFIGMFSFAVWDTINEELFAARDRFGVKPFYYHTKDNTLYFASEIKAFWPIAEKTKNDKVWAGYFTYGSYGLPNETFWKGIEQLPGGHYLKYSFHTGIQINRWYDFVTQINLAKEVNDQKFEEVYETLLMDNIALRFRSDVPVGFNISGGLDSSTLLALVNKFHPNGNITAYTFYTGDDRYDELKWVQALLKNTGNPLQTCLLTSSEVPALTKAVSYYQDEPFGGIPTLAYSKIFEQARIDGNKVLLDGQGMDEAWAGYDYYHNATDSNVQGVKGSIYTPEILNEELSSIAEKEIYPQPFPDRLSNMQYRDLFYTKIPRALRFNDRISMMHSTELREPFIDFRLVELAFSRNENFKIKDGITKWLLRKMVSKYLNDKIVLAPKRPLQTPQREWLAEDLKPFVMDCIVEAEKSGYLNKGKSELAYLKFCKNPQQSVNIWQIIGLAQFSN